MFDTAVFEIRNTFTNAHIPEPDYEMHVAVAKNDDARNLIMAENIISKFASYGCNKAVVEVGANHIATKGNLEWFLGIELDTYTPLQDRLSEKGLPSERVGSLLGQRKR